MSVMLSACRKKDAPKKKKKKTKPAPNPELSAYTRTGEDQVYKTWNWTLDSRPCSLTLKKDSMELWCNNHPMETTINFADEDDGTDMDFAIFDHKCRIKVTRQGVQLTSPLFYVLTVDGYQIDDRA
ncbi:unnamed protein product [Owenia fusiformis]|uniref:Uncharacterized protein n=1 Tax=Owenia fusiformis TaxID=6347 RepID=A0A8J1US35_OWEFU|nr:unnamed protein product [Owenia fusiformis]